MVSQVRDAAKALGTAETKAATVATRLNSPDREGDFKEAVGLVLAGEIDFPILLSSPYSFGPALYLPFDSAEFSFDFGTPSAFAPSAIGRAERVHGNSMSLTSADMAHWRGGEANVVEIEHCCISGYLGDAQGERLTKRDGAASRIGEFNIGEAARGIVSTDTVEIALGKGLGRDRLSVCKNIEADASKSGGFVPHPYRDCQSIGHMRKRVGAGGLEKIVTSGPAA